MVSIGMAEKAGWGGAGRAGGAHPAACVSVQSGSLDTKRCRNRLQNKETAFVTALLVYSSCNSRL